jgi:DNA-binding transcriptional LysR family regulator
MRHLKLYRAIRLIRREGSIRKAAEKLAVSPSALNRAILGFEEEMRVAIFDRVPGGVQLTAAGELLVDLVERHVREFENLLDMLGELRDGHRGVLRVAVGTDLAAGLVMEGIARFERENPRVCVEILLHDDPEPLRQRAVDLAFLTNPVTDDAVTVVHAWPVPIAVWLRRGGAADAITELWNVLNDRVVLPLPATGTHVAISHHLRRKRLSVPVSSATSAAHLLQRMAQGAGAGIFAACVLPPADTPADVRRLADPVGEVQVTALCAARVPMSRAATALVKAVGIAFYQPSAVSTERGIGR